MKITGFKWFHLLKTEYYDYNDNLVLNGISKISK